MELACKGLGGVGFDRAGAAVGVGVGVVVGMEEAMIGELA